MQTVIVIQLLTSFQKSLESLKIASIGSLPLEVAVAESCLTESQREAKSEGSEVSEKVAKSDNSEEQVRMSEYQKS
jgi:hypothetical protein